MILACRLGRCFYGYAAKVATGDPHPPLLSSWGYAVGLRADRGKRRSGVYPAPIGVGCRTDAADEIRGLIKTFGFYQTSNFIPFTALPIIKYTISAK